MIQATGPDNDERALQREKDAEIPMIYARTWPAVVAVVGLVAVGGGGIALLWHLSKAITDVAAADNFVAQNGLSLFILLAVVAQALIYFSQRNLMHKQWEAMRDSLAQNERAVKASEQSAEIARESLDIGEAPYFGITKIVPSDFCPEYCPRQFEVAFLNGGKTPAWHLHVKAEMVVGNNIEDGDRIMLYALHGNRYADVDQSFFPSNTEKGILYRSGLTTEQWEAINIGNYVSALRGDNVRTFLFLVINLRYHDRRETWRERTFRFLWHPLAQTFEDFDSARDQDDEDKNKNPT